MATESGMERQPIHSSPLSACLAGHQLWGNGVEKYQFPFTEPHIRVLLADLVVP